MRKALVIFAALVAPSAAFGPMAVLPAAVQRCCDSAAHGPSGMTMAAERSSRRDVLGLAAGLAAGFLLPLRDAQAADAPSGPFKLPTLPYDYKALEPAIDESTMKFHHDKHFNAVSVLPTFICRTLHKKRDLAGLSIRHG